MTHKMEWTEINLTEKMNQVVKDCLEMKPDKVSKYARKRIEELEAEVEKLSKENVSDRSELLKSFYRYVDDKWALGMLTGKVDEVVEMFLASNS